MVSLELVAVAGAADTLEVLSPIWIPCPQLADQPCWHYVIHMPLPSGLLEIQSARFDFRISVQSRDTMPPGHFGDAWLLPRLNRLLALLDQ